MFSCVAKITAMGLLSEFKRDVGRATKNVPEEERPTYETIEYNNLISANASKTQQIVSRLAKTKSKPGAFSTCADVCA